MKKDKNYQRAKKRVKKVISQEPNIFVKMLLRELTGIKN